VGVDILPERSRNYLLNPFDRLRSNNQRPKYFH